MVVLHRLTFFLDKYPVERYIFIAGLDETKAFFILVKKKTSSDSVLKSITDC